MSFQVNDSVSLTVYIPVEIKQTETGDRDKCSLSFFRGRAGLTLGSYFGQGHPGTLQVACSGDEDSIESCRLRQMSCNASRVLGVDCNGLYDM